MELIDKVIYCIYENIPRFNIKPLPDNYAKNIVNSKNLPGSILKIALKDDMVGKWLSSKIINDYVDCISLLLDIAIIQRVNNRFINDLKSLLNNLQKVERNSKDEKVILMLFYKKYQKKEVKQHEDNN